MNRLKLAVVASGALFATPVLAQDADPMMGGEAAGADMSGSTEAGMEGAPMEGTPTEGTPTDGTTPVDTGATATTGWSRSLIERPYVLGKGKISAQAAYAIAQFSFDDGMGNSASFTGDGFAIGGAYGVNDKITAGLQYSFTPGLIGDSDSEIKGDLGIYGEYQIVHNDKLDVTASADFDLDLCGSVDLMGECASTKGIHAGLGARYKLAPKMAVFTGAPYGPGAVGQHLSISLEEDGPITFDVPVGFMYQATPELNVHAMTALANLSISNSESIFFGADYIPLTIGALYSVNPNIDVVGLFVLPDLKEAQFDLYAFSVGARWYN